MVYNTGPFNLSFSTGLMLEAIFELEEPINDKNDKVDVNDFDIYYINIYTVLRNIINSLEEYDKERLLKDHYYKELEEIVTAELSNLNLLFTGSDLETVLLIPDYSSAKKLLDLKDKKVPTNFKFKLQVYLEEFFKKYYSRNPIPMFYYKKDWKLKHESRRRVLLTSHIGIDMLNYKFIKSLKILESHTGKLLDRSDLWKKLNKLKSIEMERIPYNEYTLFIYGDEPMIPPMDLKVRRDVYRECFEDKRHYSETSVYNCIRKLIKIERKLI